MWNSHLDVFIQITVDIVDIKAEMESTVVTAQGQSFIIIEI
jgi:hypothetical protein